MKLLKCKLCMGEVDMSDDNRSVNRGTRCRKCGHTNGLPPKVQSPEVFVIRKRPRFGDTN